MESTIGCDFVIVLKYGASVKILLFEAKWPRQSQNSYPWDSFVSAQSTNYPNWSRFSSQIKRQYDWRTSGAVIGELFFNDLRPIQSNNPFDNYGSDFIFSDDAKNHVDNVIGNNLTKWQTSDLLQLLPKAMNLKRLIYDTLRCRSGNLFEVIDDTVELFNVERNKRLVVPIVTSSNERGRVEEFLEMNSISNYIAVDLNEVLND